MISFDKITIGAKKLIFLPSLLEAFQNMPIVGNPAKMFPFLISSPIDMVDLKSSNVSHPPENSTTWVRTFISEQQENFLFQFFQNSRLPLFGFFKKFIPIPKIMLSTPCSHSLVIFRFKFFRGPTFCRPTTFTNPIVLLGVRRGEINPIFKLNSADSTLMRHNYLTERNSDNFIFKD